MTLNSFVAEADVDQIYLDTPYYLTPADKVSEEAFGAIRDALAQARMAAIARLVLYRRERPVLIEPYGKGMLVTTLRYEKAVREADDVVHVDGKADDELVTAVERIIGRKTAKFDPAKFEDPYEQALQKLIKSTKSRKKAPIVKAEPPPSNVINLFDALKKSLKRDGAEAKPAARGKTKQPGRRPAKAGKGKPKAARGSRRKSA